MVKEELHGARGVAQVADDDFADVEIGIRIDDVVAAEAQPEGLVLASDVGDQRLAQVAERSLPLIALYPGNRVIGKDAEARGRARVVLLSDVRKVDVGQSVLRIERDDERSVADQKVARHDSVRLPSTRHFFSLPAARRR